jgi:predicted permease
MLPRLRILWYRLLARFQRSSFERELDEEIAFHEDLLKEEGRRRGLSEDDARRFARRRFGSVRRAREGAQDSWSWAFFDHSAQDLRYAWRFLRRSPGFTIVALLSLGLGVGANTAIFTVVDRLLLRPPAHVVDDGTLRRLYLRRSYSDRTVTSGAIALPEFFAVARQVAAVQAIAAYTPPWPRRMGSDLDAPRAKVSIITGNFLSMLGVRPAFGRLLTVSDDQEGVLEPAAVISYAFWQRQFGGDSLVLGRKVEFLGSKAVIVGVAPRGFTGLELDAADIWLPMAPEKSREDGPGWKSEVSYSAQPVVRLAPGVTDAVVGAQIAAALSTVQEVERNDRGKPAPLLGPLLFSRGPGDSQPEELVANRLAIASLLVLLAACANVASLLFVRALARKREIAFRIAIGVRRARLVSQLVLEGLLIGVMGSVVAIGIAFAGGQLMRRLLFPDHSWVDGPVDGRVLVFAIACATTTAMVAALVPAVRMSRHQLLDALRSGTRTSERPGSRIRSILLSLQTAMSIVLLVGAALFARSLHRAATFDVGFAKDSLVGVRLSLDGDHTSSADEIALYQQAALRLRTVGGVAAIGIGNAVPLYGWTSTGISVPGRDSASMPDARYTIRYTVDEAYLRASGLRLTRGRVFSQDDSRGSAPVMLINETLARRIWPGETPIGRCIRLGGDASPCRSIVGMVANFRTMRLIEDQQNVAIIPLTQGSESDIGGIVVRATSDPIDLAPRVKAALRGIRDDFASLSVEPVARTLDHEMRPWRLGSTMFSLLAGLTLLLAAVGLFGTVAFTVVQRTSEIGIRSALGARKSHVARVVVADALLPVLVGLGCGLALAGYGSGMVSALLFETSRSDPASYALAVSSLVVAALCAVSLPLQRATHIDPASALRSE